MGIPSITLESESWIVLCWALQFHMKKTPAQSNRTALLPSHTPLLWREMGKVAKATAWELLQVVEEPSPHLLQAQSTSHTTAKAARCSLPPSPSPQVLRHFFILFQNLILLVCKYGEVLFYFILNFLPFLNVRLIYTQYCI